MLGLSAEGDVRRRFQKHVGGDGKDHSEILVNNIPEQEFADEQGNSFNRYSSFLGAKGQILFCYSRLEGCFEVAALVVGFCYNMFRILFYDFGGAGPFSGPIK